MTRSHPQTQMNLTYVQVSGDTLAGSDGTDCYTGLDRFARVVDEYCPPRRWTHQKGGCHLFRAQIAEGLEIDASTSFTIIEFGSEGVNGIAVPIRSTSPGFIGNGFTSGGFPE